MNEKLTTLGRVAEEVELMRRNHNDELVPVKEMEFQGANSLRIGSDVYPLQPVARQAIATRMGVPNQYLEKLPDHIAAVNLNHFLRHERNNELFIRFDAGEIRYLATPKYHPNDNDSVIKELYRLGYADSTPVQVRLDTRLMMLNIPQNERAFDVAAGDTLMPGIAIANSEVGLAALALSAFLLRLACTNGLIHTEKVSYSSYRHISSRPLEELPSAIRMIESGTEVQQRQLRFSLESPVKDIDSTLAMLCRQFQLTQDEQQAVNWATPMESTDEANTMFNVVNVFTKASQYDVLTADSAFRLQRSGGKVLSMVKQPERLAA